MRGSCRILQGFTPIPVESAFPSDPKASGPSTTELQLQPGFVPSGLGQGWERHNPPWDGPSSPRSPTRNCVLVPDDPDPLSQLRGGSNIPTRAGRGTRDRGKAGNKAPHISLGHKKVFSMLRIFAGFFQGIQEREGLKSLSSLPLKPDSISVLSSNHDSEQTPPIPLPRLQAGKIQPGMSCAGGKPQTPNPKPCPGPAPGDRPGVGSRHGRKVIPGYFPELLSIQGSTKDLAETGHAAKRETLLKDS